MATSMPRKLIKALGGIADPTQVQAFGPAQLLPVDKQQTYQRAARNAVRVAATSWTGTVTYQVAAGGFWVVTGDQLALVRRYPNATQPWDVVMHGPLAGVEAVPGGTTLRPTLTLLAAADGEPLVRLGFPLFSGKRDALLGLINAASA